MNIKAICIAACAIVGVSTTALGQQHRGSAEDQVACTPDVYRLCAQYIPDEDDIVACLIRKKPQLSPGCHEVFSRPDAAQAPKPDNDD